MALLHTHGGAGQKGEGGPFLWGPVCVAPTHKWREGDLHTAYVPTAHSCPCGPSHCTPQCLWGGGGGACVTPACVPLLVHACVRALLPVTATPDTPDCAEANWGGGCTAKGCMQFPSSAGHPVLCTQGRKWGRNGGQHLHTPVRWAGRGWKGGWHHLPRGGPPLCPLSANAGVREGGGRSFHTLPYIPHLCTEPGWGKPCTWKGRRGEPMRGRTVGGHTARGGRGMQKAVCMPCPLCTSPICMPCCMQRGEGRRKGERRGAQGYHVPHGSPCTLFTNGGGGVMPHRPIPVHCQGANERPHSRMNRSRPKGQWGVLCSLSCACQGGSGQREGGVPFIHHPASHLCTEVGGANPAHGGRGKQGGWHQQGTSGGTHRQATWHRGGMFAPLPLAHPCVCFLTKGGGRFQRVEVRGGRVGG
jgi:hypothetical protein